MYVCMYVSDRAAVGQLHAVSARHAGPFFFFFFTTLKPRVESYKSLSALITSPPRNCFTLLWSVCFRAKREHLQIFEGLFILVYLVTYDSG